MAISFFERTMIAHRSQQEGAILPYPFFPNQICFPLFSVHVKITEYTNHALPIVSSETNHVSVCQFPA